MGRKAKYFCKHCKKPILTRALIDGKIVHGSRRQETLECYSCVPLKRGQTPSDINPVSGFRICRECKNEFPDAPEYFKQYSDSGYNGCFCKPCAVEIKKKVVRKNGDKVARACIELLGDKCNICKLSFSSYDFHHLDPKIKEAKVSSIGSLTRALKEAAKCILLCANCHRETHAGYHPEILKTDFTKYRASHVYRGRRRAKIAAIEYKGGKCLDCGYSRYSEALQFHHREQNSKDKELNEALFSLISFEKMKPELDKCDLLCANCHVKRHTI